MSAHPPLDDLREQRLARYRAGAMSAAERAAFEADVLADDALAEALYGELSLDSVTGPVAGVPSRVRPAWWRIALPVAASFLAVAAWMVLRPSPPMSVGPAGGGDTVRGARMLDALGPSGDLLAPPESLRWTSAAGATSYRVELFDESGRSLGVLVTPDTVAAMRALTSEPLRSGRWRVVAIGPDGLDREEKAHATWSVRTR